MDNISVKKNIQPTLPRAPTKRCTKESITVNTMTIKCWNTWNYKSFQCNVTQYIKHPCIWGYVMQWPKIILVPWKSDNPCYYKQLKPLKPIIISHPRIRNLILQLGNIKSYYCETPCLLFCELTWSIVQVIIMG